MVETFGVARTQGWLADRWLDSPAPVLGFSLRLARFGFPFPRIFSVVDCL